MELLIAVNTAVIRTKITHNNKFFCLLFSELVISKSGTEIQIIIQIISLNSKVSLKKKKLIIIIKIGPKVLYNGKKITASIFFIAETLENIDEKKNNEFQKASNVIK